MAHAAPQIEATHALPDKEGKYLTFTLAQEDYGLEILKVREIIGMMDITAIPQTPPYIKGVINLRGRVIPVLDLRLKFQLPAVAYGERTCIIVVDVQCGQGVVQVGLVVDAVSEVLSVTGEDVEPPRRSEPGSMTPLFSAWPRPGGPSRSCWISTVSSTHRSWPVSRL